MAEHIVCNANKCVFLAKHLSVFADKRQAVDIGVDYHAEVEAAACHLLHDAREILLQWFGVVGEVACRLGVEELVFYAQRVEQLGENDAANTVDGVDTNFEMRCLDSFYIYQFQCQHAVDVALVKCIVFSIVAQVVDIGILKRLALSDVEHFISVIFGKEFALAVKQLQRVPLTWVVACGDDDATIGATPAHSKLCGRRCCQSDVYHVEAHAHECAANYILHHLTRDACVTSYNNLVALACATNKGSVGRCKLNDVERIDRVACRTADSTANTRNRFD